MKSLLFIWILCLGCLRTQKSPFDISNPSGSGAFGALGISISGSNSSSNSDTYTLTSLSYTPSTVVFAANVIITNMVPIVTGTPEAYSISPIGSLPAGLSFDTTTGIISGTPTTVYVTPIPFTITATNSTSSVTANVVLSVVTAISGFTYSGGAPTGGSIINIGGVTTIRSTRSVAFSHSPAINGTSPTYSISPGLPAGLSFNTTTGAITGTPTTAQSAVTYTVTANNSYGNSITTFDIVVQPLVFVATFGVNGGLGISKDGGVTYTMNNSMGTSVESISVCSDYTIFVTDRTGGSGGVYKSTDNGVTFVLKRGPFQTYSVYCDPLNSSIVYTVAVDGASTLHFYRSTDGGSTFSIVSDTITTSNGITSSGTNYFYSNGGSVGTGGAYKSTNGTNFSTTILSSSNYVSDIYSNASILYAVDSTNKQLLISSDNGISFPITKSFSATPGKIMTSSDNVNVYITSGSGLYVSNDSSGSFNLKTTANGLNSNSLANVFVYQDGKVYVAATGAVNISNDNGNSFSSYNSGLTNTSLMDIFVK
ncbi:MAG: putative Ig domain-containing protein [Leptospiraceae bacterium]|nr:putative Ig domain-containing protein [Leptospiraceae bacterium]